MEVEQADPVTVRQNAVYLQGVDDLSTSDIEDFMVAYYNKPFQIEWINDTSLAIVYDEDDDAAKALAAITQTSEPATELAPTELRAARRHPKKDEVEILARSALSSDQKSQGSRAKSRYYLLHGEPDWKQDLARFGTKRSEPMKYGIRNKDIISKRRRANEVGDLFPSKAPTVPLNEDIMDDLLPEKTKKKSRRRRNKKAALPDLFADKVADNEPDLFANKEQSGSIYQNMDY